jgi:hypothetical protein
LGTFVADADLVLRQVHFFVDPAMVVVGCQALSTDPSFTRPPTASFSNEFQLRTIVSGALAQNTSYRDLAFPIQKGKKLYWASIGGSSTDQLITLVFT